jgi:hypothetical protein
MRQTPSGQIHTVEPRKARIENPIRTGPTASRRGGGTTMHLYTLLTTYLNTHMPPGGR